MNTPAKLLSLGVAALLAVAAQSCLSATGIDSTPRITSKAVDRAGVRLSDEQQFAAAITNEPPSRWMPGKRWRVTAPKIKVAFSPAHKVNVDSLVGHDVYYVGHRPVATFDGMDRVEITFADARDNQYQYRPVFKYGTWDEAPYVLIPFTVELSVVELADSMMRGNTYYITTPRWLDAQGNTVEGLRHIPVTVDSVVPGTENYPLRVAFHPAEGSDAAERYILMTHGSGKAATRNFDRLFSFENPRRLYPRISDETWAKIIRSKVAQGMTRDECRLALGAPNNIDRGATRSYQVEMWSYDNGVYLVFEDGILTKFRN